jgi:hypothetical protein
VCDGRPRGSRRPMRGVWPGDVEGDRLTCRGERQVSGAEGSMRWNRGDCVRDTVVIEGLGREMGTTR